MLSLGFTGTRRNLPPAQVHALATLMQPLRPIVFHHGGCIGADAVAHSLAVALGWIIEVHWADVPPELRAPCRGALVYHPPKPPLVRNGYILRGSTILIAAPAGPETQRSGTWSTVRAARKAQVPVRIVWPDGTVA